MGSLGGWPSPWSGRSVLDHLAIGNPYRFRVRLSAELASPSHRMGTVGDRVNAGARGGGTGRRRMAICVVPSRESRFGQSACLEIQSNTIGARAVDGHRAGNLCGNRWCGTARPPGHVHRRKSIEPSLPELVPAPCEQSTSYRKRRVDICLVLSSAHVVLGAMAGCVSTSLAQVGMDPVQSRAMLEAGEPCHSRDGGRAHGVGLISAEASASRRLAAGQSLTVASAPQVAINIPSSDKETPVEEPT